MTRDGVVSERREGGVRVQNFTVRNESELDQCLEAVADAAYKTVAAVKKRADLLLDFRIAEEGGDKLSARLRRRIRRE